MNDGVGRAVISNGWDGYNKKMLLLIKLITNTWEIGRENDGAGTNLTS